MAGYHASGQDQARTFELFVRGLPDHRQYLVAAGLEQALEYLATLHFTADEIAWLQTLRALADVPASFFETYLPAFRFTGDVWAVEEGEVVFDHEPIVRVTAPAAEAQLVETALLGLITFQTSVASKASRVVTSAEGRAVIEFGSRRAHGLDAAVHAARAAYIAGCASTSNLLAGRLFGIPVSGHHGAFLGDGVCRRDRRVPAVHADLRRAHHAAHRHLRHPHGRTPHRRERSAADGRAPGQRRPAGPVAAGAADLRRRRPCRHADPGVGRPRRASHSGAGSQAARRSTASVSAPLSAW